MIKLIYSGKKKYRRIRKAYYYTCPFCGANLDPGEECDCRSSAA